MRDASCADPVRERDSLSLILPPASYRRLGLARFSQVEPNDRIVAIRHVKDLDIPVRPSIAAR